LAYYLKYLKIDFTIETNAKIRINTEIKLFYMQRLNMFEETMLEIGFKDALPRISKGEGGLTVLRPSP